MAGSAAMFGRFRLVKVGRDPSVHSSCSVHGRGIFHVDEGDTKRW